MASPCRLFYVLISFHLFLCIQSESATSYWKARNKLVAREKNKELGANLQLSEKELKVNDILMKYKLKEWDEGLQNPGEFLAAQHFFKAKKGIEESDVFKFIKKLPKGASLHSHSTGTVSDNFVLSLTHKDNLYGCEKGENFLMKFFKNATSVDDECQWKAMSEYRAERADFDEYLRKKLTLVVDDPLKKYPDVNAVWDSFDNCFSNVGGMIDYKPVFKEYFYQVLKEFYEDNVMYIEMRKGGGATSGLYDFEGNVYSGIGALGIYIETLEEFKKDHPDFYGARMIYAPYRLINNETLHKDLANLKNFQKEYPNFIAGFDLVGQEDLGKPLSEFIPQLLEAKSQTKFFFHAGETNWKGESDMNLIDAVMLDTKRIGHGYAIMKHPEVYSVAKAKGIAIEVNPISNQVLRLVDDLRNHPAVTLVADGYPIVICCDDPSFWGAKGLSYDWYYAFMAFGGRDSDLKLLKQLAINSIMHSSLSCKEKRDLRKKWQVRWDEFIDNMLKE